jgi:hypothetical protein
VEKNFPPEISSKRAIKVEDYKDINSMALDLLESINKKMY